MRSLVAQQRYVKAQTRRMEIKPERAVIGELAPHIQSFFKAQGVAHIADYRESLVQAWSLVSGWRISSG